MQEKTEVAFLLYLNLLNFNEVNWNLTGLTTGNDCGQSLLSVVLLYLFVHQIPHDLGCRAYLSVWQEEGAFCMEHLAIPADPSTLHFISVMGNCLLGGLGVHGWVVRFSATGAVSILELAANGGGSRISQAPTLHQAKQLSTQE